LASQKKNWTHQGNSTSRLVKFLCSRNRRLRTTNHHTDHKVLLLGPTRFKTPSAILGVCHSTKSVSSHSHSYRLLLIDSTLLCQEQPVSLFQRDSMPVKSCKPPIHMCNLICLISLTANICRLERSALDAQILPQLHRRLS
jgi:hypothetical protein